MKTLSLAASAELAKKLGVEPIILVQLEIPNNFLHLADKTVTRNSIIWQGKISAIGTINTEKRTDLVGSVSSLQLELDDSDQVLRQRLNTERWISQKAKVFHSFGAVDETFLVFAGKISTPLAWKESDRTLSFEIVSDYTSLQAGLEITEDTYAGGLNGAVPLAFGTVVNACPVKIYENVNASLVTPFVRRVIPVAVPEINVFPYGSWAKSPYQTQYGNYWYKFNGQYVVRYVTYSESFDVDSSAKFPQDTTIQLSGGNFIGQIEGQFHGNTFAVSKLIDQLKTLSKGDIAETNKAGERPSFLKVQDSDSYDYTFAHLVFHTVNSANEAQEITIAVLSQDEKKLYLEADVPENWISIDVRVPAFSPNPNLFDPVQTTVMQVGDKVYLDNNGIIEAYAFSAMPYSGLKLLGYQVFNGKKNLRELPSTFYDIVTNFEGSGFTAITIPKSFSAYKVEVPDKNFSLHWEDSFYVSFQSSVGSNVSDVIKYIIQHYTTLEIDLASFDAVKLLVDKYPVNFMFKDAPDALDMIATICYQSRCAITIKNGIVFLKYLSKEPTPVAEIFDSQIVEGSMEIAFTDLSQIKTSLTAKYDKDCVDHQIKKTTYPNNVNIYGLIKEEKTYTIYTNDALVKKSNAFWGFRISNQWKLLKFTTVLTSLAVDQGDCIYISSELYTGKAIVENTQYQSDKSEVVYEVWTPVVAGTNVQSPLAWLSDTADIKPSNLTISAPKADVYSLSFPVSDYGVHSRESLIVTVTSDEDADGLVTWSASDGTSGIAQNLNESGTFKKGDRTVVIKDKYNKFYTQAPGGGGSVPVRIYDYTVGTATVFIDVYGNGFDKDPTASGVEATLTTVPTDLETPLDTVASLVNGDYIIDLAERSYSAKATGDSDSSGNVKMDILDSSGKVIRNVTAAIVGTQKVRTGTTTLATNSNGKWIVNPGVDGLIPVQVMVNNNDGTCIIDVYELGFDKPITEDDVSATIINDYFRSMDTPFYTFATRISGSYSITQKSKTTYFAVASSDSTSLGVFNANLRNIDANTTYKAITGIQIVNNKGVVKSGDTVIVTKEGSKWYCVPTTASNVAGGAGDSVIASGTDVTKAGKLGDLVKVTDDNKAALNLTNAAVVADSGGNAILLSTLLQIVSGQVCIKTAALFTDGTNVGQMQLVNDGGVWRPASTMLID